jgi:thioredoxin 1
MKISKPFFLKTAVATVLLLFVFAFSTSTTTPIKTIEYYVDGKAKVKWLDLVKQELAAKRKPVLFFTATWCGPCKQFKNSLGDPLMTDALKDATLIMIDGDVDAKNDKIAGKYKVSAYPTFLRVDETGKLLNKTDGGAWDENIPVNMAPVMKAFMK